MTSEGKTRATQKLLVAAPGGLGAIPQLPEIQAAAGIILAKDPTAVAALIREVLAHRDRLEAWEAEDHCRASHLSHGDGHTI